MLLGTTRGPNIYTRPNYTYPLGIFQGILSEYLALKYGPQVVYMDFRYFLVTKYIYPHIVGCALAYPLVQSRSIAEKIKGCPSLWSRGCPRFT